VLYFTLKRIKEANIMGKKNITAVRLALLTNISVLSKQFFLFENIFLASTMEM
jgi:hypothetical protein